MARVSIRSQIQELAPVGDHQRIVHLSTCYDFAFDTTRALEFALFRTFAVPRISEVLDRTGEFGNRAQRRYDDTDLLISEFMENGYDSEPGKRAIRRMNQLHGRFDIRNEDFLYVLSTFVCEPVRWNERYGWRRLCDNEIAAYAAFWHEVGRRMGMKDVPESFEAFDRFNREFEQKRFVFAESNRRVGGATRDMMVRWFPRPLAPLVRWSIYAMMDDPLREAVGFPRAPWLFRKLVPLALKIRAWFLRLLPARRGPRRRTDMRHTSHPEGYVIEQLGPPGVA